MYIYISCRNTDDKRFSSGTDDQTSGQVVVYPPQDSPKKEPLRDGRADPSVKYTSMRIPPFRKLRRKVNSHRFLLNHSWNNSG